MRVAIAGAGAVGRAIAHALLTTHGHADNQVLLIESRRSNFDPGLVPAADWLFADACELETLQAAGIDTCHVVIAATGEDKANLVFAMLCKSQFGVDRVVARVNEPGNAWLFDDAWGVDIAMSTPSTLAVAVEQAVTVGDVIRLMTLQQGGGNIVEIALPPDSRFVGAELGDLTLPTGAVTIAIMRAGRLLTPRPSVRLAAADEIVFVADADTDVEGELRVIMAPRQR